jgi:hypothetical protein
MDSAAATATSAAAALVLFEMGLVLFEWSNVLPYLMAMTFLATAAALRWLAEASFGLTTAAT